MMKHVPQLVVLVLIVAGCNLSNKLKPNNNSNSNSSSSSPSSGDKSSTGGEPVEKPNPTAAQTATLANGETVNWDQQGISWTVPPSWKKQSVSLNSFQYGGDGAFLIVSISAMDSSFPTEITLRGFHEGAKVREKNGEVDELKWLELDGQRGVEFRESKPEDLGSPQRLQWMTYRKYANQTQLVNIILSSSGKNFPTHLDELYAILFSTKLVH
jgi:hypothetical protein